MGRLVRHTARSDQLSCTLAVDTSEVLSNVTIRKLERSKPQRSAESCASAAPRESPTNSILDGGWRTTVVPIHSPRPDGACMLSVDPPLGERHASQRSWWCPSTPACTRIAASGSHGTSTMDELRRAFTSSDCGVPLRRPPGELDLVPDAAVAAA
eukprot:scaffold275264_cov39-Tisochrysis_lutea.AAC.3